MVRPVTLDEVTLVEPLLINPAKYKNQHESLATNVFHKEPLPEHQGRKLTQPIRANLTAFDVNEGTEIRNTQTMTLTRKEFEPTEIAAQAALTDKAVRASGENEPRAVGKLLGMATRAKKDTKGLEVFEDATTHSLGDGTTNIALSKLRSAVILLNGGTEPADGQVYSVVRPEQMGNLLDEYIPTANTAIPSGVSEEVMEKYLAKEFKLFGLNGAFWSGNIARAGSPKTAIGGVFAKNAVWYVPASSLEVEKERKMAARAWVFQATEDFHFGIYNQAHIVKLNYKAVDPS